MAREYNALMPANTLVTTTFPFAQIQAAAAIPLTVLGIELTQEASTTSQMLVLLAAIRSTASTTFANTGQTISRADAGDAASGATFNWGITTVAGTLTETKARWAFNALTGLYEMLIPELRITIPGGQYFTLALAAAPSPAVTLSANIWLAEGAA